MGFDVDFKRSVLSRESLEYITVTDKGIVLNLPRRKTDQEERGQQVALLAGQRLQTEQLPKKWL